MKQANQFSRTTVAEIRKLLEFRISSHFANGDVVYSKSAAGGDFDYPDGDVTTSTAFGYPEDDQTGMTAADINFKRYDDKYYKQRAKHAAYLLQNETIELPAFRIRYNALYQPLRESAFSRKTYRPVFAAMPIRIDLNGERKPAAKLEVELWLDEETVLALQKRCAGCGENAVVRLRVDGSACLSGGKAKSIGGRTWLEYCLSVFAETYEIIGITE